MNTNKMRTATLTRKKTGDSGTFGMLVTDNGQTFISGELPWRDNARGLSCIPLGEYVCIWTFSPAHSRQLYQLQGVKDRSEVQIHPGNYCGDTTKGMRSDVMGCIILGMTLGRLEGQDAVITSKGAVRDFEDAMGCEPFKLAIVAAPDMAGQGWTVAAK